MLALEAIGPLTILAGIGGRSQPYRVAFFYPEGKGLWDWAVQPPLLVVASASPSLLVTPGLVEDMERHESGSAMPRAEVAHWLFAGGFLFLGLVLLAEAVAGPDVVRRRAWRACLWPSSRSSRGCGSG